MGAMNKAVENGVGDRRLSDIVEPLFDWQLTSDNGRGRPDTIVKQI